MTKQKAEGKRKAGNGSFEQSLAELESIVAEMESGTLGLEDMIARFEKGQALVRLCTEKLNEVERKIEVLVKKGGEVVAAPFEPEEEAGPAGGDAPDESPGESRLL